MSSTTNSYHSNMTRWPRVHSRGDLHPYTTQTSGNKLPEEDLDREFEAAFHKLIAEESLPQHISIKIETDALKDFRFSQVTISPAIRTGMKLDQLKESILQDGWDPSYPLHITYMPDWKVTSFDNRRLFVLKDILQTHPSKRLDVNVILDFHPDRIDSATYGRIFSRMIQWDSKTDQEMVGAELEAIIKAKQILPNSYGYGILGRMHGIEANRRKYLNIEKKTFWDSNLYGFSSSPIIWDKKQQQSYLRQMLMAR